MRTKPHVVAVAVSVAIAGVPLLPAMAEPPAMCAGHPVTIVSTDGDDQLTGTDGVDVVALGAGNDSFKGGEGDDVVCGGPGRDSLYGDAGDDWLDGGDDDDYDVVGGPGDDVVHGGPGDDGRLLGDDVRVDSGEDQVHGDAGDDTLKGEPGTAVDLLDGGEGQDTVSYYLSGGSVVIDVAAGTATGDSPDTLAGLETYSGSEYDDVLIGSAEDDRLYGGYGDDTIEGRAGDDTLSATGGTIAGGRGQDTFVSHDEESDGLEVRLGADDDLAVLDALRDSVVVGGPGDDVFDIPAPRFGVDADGTYARLRGGSGHDRLTFAANARRVRIDVRTRTATWSQGGVAFAGVDEFHGSTSADVLLGSRLADRLFGGGGDDVLRGRAGPDHLRGGAGRDTAYGGPGRDRCSTERRFSCERRG